jgi:hypothetical protein
MQYQRFSQSFIFKKTLKYPSIFQPHIWKTSCKRLNTRADMRSKKKERKEPDTGHALQRHTPNYTPPPNRLHLLSLHHIPIMP